MDKASQPSPLHRSPSVLRPTPSSSFSLMSSSMRSTIEESALSSASSSSKASYCSSSLVSEPSASFEIIPAPPATSTPLLLSRASSSASIPTALSASKDSSAHSTTSSSSSDLYSVRYSLKTNSEVYHRRTPLLQMSILSGHTLATILSADNNWRKLMAIIPKKLDPVKHSGVGQLNWERAVATNGLKYTNRDIVRMEKTYLLPHCTYLQTELLIVDWAETESPTVGILYQLCVKAELFDAADKLAKLLDETKPKRPASEGDTIKNSFLLSKIFKNIIKINIDYVYHNDADLERRGDISHTICRNKFITNKWNKERQEHTEIKVTKYTERTNEMTRFVSWHFEAKK